MDCPHCLSKVADSCWSADPPLDNTPPRGPAVERTLTVWCDFCQLASEVVARYHANGTREILRVRGYANLIDVARLLRRLPGGGNVIVRLPSQAKAARAARAARAATQPTNRRTRSSHDTARVDRNIAADGAADAVRTDDPGRHAGRPGEATVDELAPDPAAAGGGRDGHARSARSRPPRRDRVDQMTDHED